MALPVGNIENGLRALRTKHQNDADQIAALEEINRLGGLEQTRTQLERGIAGLREAHQRGSNAVVAINDSIAEAQERLARIEGEAGAIANTASTEAKAVIDAAKVEAQRIVDKAKTDADAVMRTASEAATRTVSVADDTRKDLERQHVGLLKSIDDAKVELNRVSNAANQARRAHETFIENLKKA